MMARIDQSRIWEEAASPPNDSLVRRFIVRLAQGQGEPSRSGELPPRRPRPAGRRRSWLSFAPTWRSVARPASWFASSRISAAFPNSRRTCWSRSSTRSIASAQDAGEAPDPHEYDARFPAIAAEVRDLIDIHEFVDSSPDDLLVAKGPDETTPHFRAAGETIGGFRLVEELGRGANGPGVPRPGASPRGPPGGPQGFTRRLARAADPGAFAAHAHRPCLLVSRRRRHGPSFALHALFRPGHAG